MKLKDIDLAPIILALSLLIALSSISLVQGSQHKTITGKFGITANGSAAYSIGHSS